MCNLYSPSKGQLAIRAAARAMRDGAGNLPVLPGIYPDGEAPIARTAPDGVRGLAMARWRMPRLRSRREAHVTYGPSMVYGMAAIRDHGGGAPHVQAAALVLWDDGDLLGRAPTEQVLLAASVVDLVFETQS